MIAHRFRENLAALGLDRPDRHLLVALSGGCDSVVLLHLLRFAAGSAAPRLTAAHFDHAMREDSAADTEWVRGVCRAWNVPLITSRAERPPRSETEARTARYRFLRRAATDAGATRIATAHHADDQAETVLFRVLRGTGLRGLAGIPPDSPAGIVRPLLPFWRTEVEGYARAAGLRWREDPSNRSLDYTRNRLRREVLPYLERAVAPEARRSLVRLAELAREAEEGWASVFRPLEAGLVIREEGELVLARQPFREYHPALASRLLRSALRRLGSTPSRAGTRMALQFITDASSGREFGLPDGVRIRTEYDQVRVTRNPDPEPDVPLRIAAAEGAGRGELRCGGRRYEVAWRVAPGAADQGQADAAWSAAFAYDRLRFPLELRSWHPGDRIRLGAGRRSLKKLFADRRVPGALRSRTPVLVDAEGEVLWVAGMARAEEAAPETAGNALFLTIAHG